MRVLTLVLYSEDLPVYKEHLKAWRMYSKSNSSFDVFFIISSSTCTKTKLIDDILYVSGEENLQTMTNKFISALDYFEYQNYDFILRTNMSSFWVFQNLIPVLEKLPRENLLAGEICENYFVSGAGMIFSPDVCDFLRYNRIALFQFASDILDDVKISIFLRTFYDITYTQIYPRRYDINVPDDGKEEKIPHDTFHFRVKQPTEKRYLEFEIMNNLYKRFYNNSNVLPNEPSSSQS